MDVGEMAGGSGRRKEQRDEGRLDRLTKIRKKKREIFEVTKQETSSHLQQQIQLEAEFLRTVPSNTTSLISDPEDSSRNNPPQEQMKDFVSFSASKIVRNSMYYGDPMEHHPEEYSSVMPIVSLRQHSDKEVVTQSKRERKLLKRKDKVTITKYQQIIVVESGDQSIEFQQDVEEEEEEQEQEEHIQDKESNSRTSLSSQIESSTDHLQPPMLKLQGTSQQPRQETQEELKPASEKQLAIQSIETLFSVNDSILSLKAVMRSPVPPNSVMRCYIQRNPSSYKLTLQLFLDDDRFLLKSEAQNASIGCNSYISVSQEVNKSLQSYMGKLRSDFAGSVYNLYDSGASGREGKSQQSMRSILVSTQYQNNILGIKGPRKLKVAIPNPSHPDRSIFKLKDKENLFSLQQNHPQSILIFRNKQPVWSEKLKTYALNFGGRVKMPSIKNFILEGEDNKHLLVFGRIDTHKFSLELRHPLSPFQAFGVAMTSFDFKFNCE